MDIPATSSPIAHPSAYEAIYCADCNAECPEWASINKGVLICNDCCIVHRSLGRHISHIRSLKRGLWDNPQLQLANLLHRSGSNRIWEHAFMDPSSSHKAKKKPSPHDPVLPTKETFIKSKYVDLAFTLKPSKDDDPVSSDDLNKQLWASVRTSHVDTALRLMAMGADPNYADPETGNTPLHVAAKENQPMQAELLFVYGADPNAVNKNQQTPADLAKQESHTELSHRLEELCFEVTNRLSMFLCGRKPEHKGRDHFLIPELAGNLEGHRSLKKQLQVTTDQQFEKLAQDVYDEADRRQTHAAWAATTQGKTILSGNDQYVAVFLPLNPGFSATRNQLRQKLAKYDDREFAALAIDILKESKRRYLGEPIPEDDLLDSSTHLNTSRVSMQNESARDYDEVPDMFSRENGRGSGVTRSSGQKTRSTDSIDAGLDQKSTFDDILELRERVSDSEGKIKTLTSTSQQILKIVSQLQTTMEHIRADNASLKSEVFKLNEQLSLVKRNPTPASSVPNSVERASSLAPEKDRTMLPPLGRTSVPADIMESRSIRRQGLGSTQTMPISRSTPSGRHSIDHQIERSEFRDIGRSRGPRDHSREKRPPMDPSDILDSDYATVSPPPAKIEDVFSEDCLVRETEKLTGAIRDLLQDAQKRNLAGNASDHAHRIASLINQIILLVPQELRQGKIESTIATLKDATVMLSAKCNAPVLDTEDTCHAAYSVAQGAKMLLMIFHN